MQSKDFAKEAGKTEFTDTLSGPSAKWHDCGYRRSAAGHATAYFASSTQALTRFLHLLGVQQVFDGFALTASTG
ncbi:MAG: hypothetical protein KIS65_05340 [Nitrosomonas sp.]|nr:hypothetical protein [Nitrosomonas sp.]